MPRGAVLLVGLLLILLAPTAGAAQTSQEALLGDIDAYWAQAFANAGLDYRSPRLVAIDEARLTPCGQIDPYSGPGAYCAADETVYYSPLWFGGSDVPASAGFAVVLAHEWTHHVQVLLGEFGTIITEPQADCGAGAYIHDAEERGVISPGDVALALRLTNASGDVPWAASDEGFPHGPGTLRSSAFMTGELQGLEACDLGV